MATTPRNSAPSSQVASGGMAELPALAVSRENDRLAFVMAALLESGAQLVARASQRLRPAQPGQAGSALWQGFSRELLAEVRSRSEEHTSELQSLMRISYAVFCMKKKKNI